MAAIRTEAAPVPERPPERHDAQAFTRALVEGLRSPLSYPHAAGCVEVLETHISYVVLAGDFAYKVRKPVRLPFLDFTTLAARQRDCEEELRLNRRFAPALYRGVVPITGSPDAPRVEGAGEAIEYAVRMGRFDPHLLLDALARAGELRGADIDRLASAIARLHAQAPPAPATAPFGTSALVLRQALDNFSALRAADDAATGGLAQTLREWTLLEHARLEPVLEARRRAGFVRDGHGDLHLGNVVMQDGEPVPFDCIEFDPALRVIDTMSDVAFTWMDLQHHGMPAWAARFLDRYMEATGDSGGLRVLRFFAVYRALVRAKVAALGAPAADAWAKARACLELAAGIAAPPPAMLVLMHGLSGSGKTRVSTHLVEALGAVRLRSDVERKRRRGLDALARSASPVGGGLYAPHEVEGTYQRLMELAAEVLDAGYAAIVDATFLKRAQREPFERLARERDVPCAIVACEAPEAELRRRLAIRAAALADASEADAQVLSLQLTAREPLTAEEERVAVHVDTAREGAAREAADALLRRL